MPFVYRLHVPAVATGSTADVLTLAPGHMFASANSSPVIVSSYVFHEGDNDWFLFTAPTANGIVDIVWNHTPISSGANGIGHYNGSTNPLGGDFGMLVFDQAWFDDSGHLTTIAQTVGGVGYDLSVGSNTKTVSVPVIANENYYVYLNAIRGWNTTETYTLTLTLQ